MEKNKLEIETTIEYESYKKSEVMEKIYNLLKELNVIKLEFEEKEN